MKTRGKDDKAASKNSPPPTEVTFASVPSSVGAEAGVEVLSQGRGPSVVVLGESPAYPRGDLDNSDVEPQAPGSGDEELPDAFQEQPEAPDTEEPSEQAQLSAAMARAAHAEAMTAPVAGGPPLLQH